MILKKIKSNSTITPVLNICSNAIANNQSEHDRNYKPSRHDIEKSLKTLDERDDFDRLDLIKLEFLYAEILYSDSGYGIPNLAKEVSNSPFRNRSDLRLVTSSPTKKRILASALKSPWPKGHTKA